MDTPKGTALIGGIGFLVLLALSSLGLSVSDRGILQSALLIGTLAVSVQVVYGMLGELSLGQGAIFGVGAYAYALVAQHSSTAVGAVSALCISVCIALAIGLLLGRVQGAYFAVITYAITVLMGTVASGTSAFGGSQGLTGVVSLPVIFASAVNTGPLIYTGIAFFAGVVLLYASWRSPIGLALEVTKADRRVARAMGINTRSAVATAMVVSSVPAALAGIAFAGTGLYVGPSVFGTYYIIIPLSILALGGVRSLLGALTGCLLEIGLPLVLNVNALTLQIASGVVLAVVVIGLPSGLNSLIGIALRKVVRSIPLRIRMLRSFRGLGVAANRSTLGADPATDESRGQQMQRSVDRHSNRIGSASLIGDKSLGRPDSGSLAAKDVTVKFGGLSAVEDATVTVERGEIIGLIGPNGAGKTTLVGAIAGSILLTSGTIEVDGDRLQGLPDYRRARRGVARTFQDVALIDSLSVRQSLLVAQDGGRFLQHGFKVPPLNGYAREAIADCGLESRLESKVAQLTNLERRILAVALALTTRPKFLLLDESTAGLSTQDRRTFIDVIRRNVVRRRLGVIVIEHDVEFVAEISDRIVAMSRGGVIAAGPAKEVLADDRVITSYLGRGWSHPRA